MDRPDTNGNIKQIAKEQFNDSSIKSSGRSKTNARDGVGTAGFGNGQMGNRTSPFNVRAVDSNDSIQKASLARYDAIKS